MELMDTSEETAHSRRDFKPSVSTPPQRQIHKHVQLLLITRLQKARGNGFAM